MKKFLIMSLCVLTSLFCVFLFSCKKQESVTDYISEYRFELYRGEYNGCDIKAGYGYKESPFINDGNVGDKVYSLTFKMSGNQSSNSSYSVSVVFGGEKYKTDFIFNPVSDSFCANLEIEGFNLKEFTAIITSGANSQTVNMKSTVPEKTLSVEDAFKSLSEKSPEFINSYYTDGVFTGEIIARITVKNEKPYWFVGLLDGKGNEKAFLIDGFSGDVLAVRKIF